MTHPTSDPTIPDPADRAARNTALQTNNTETGFWDEHGRPAPWPDDIDHWQPETSGPTTYQPGHQPF
ncbi:hypothetical protein AB0H83_23620 [Dactylosporangium sp. NPDC050688]|uniref:hypothetical protein n=1 Tax=Dactylosporangium sp. NPDC050688 TaxID=3157217 RepID=UPI0033FC4A65